MTRAWNLVVYALALHELGLVESDEYRRIQTKIALMPSEQFDVDEIEKLLSKPQRALLQLILAAETSPEQVDSPPALP
jgi:hypothetical protein